MIGKYQIQLGAEQLISGMSSSDYATDGSLGTGAHDTNPFLLPGAIAATAIPTDSSTNIADNFIATCEDSINVGGERLAVGNGGKYYTIGSSNNVTNVVSGSDTTNYKFPQTDIAVQMGGSGNTYAFVSHGTNLALWNGSTSLTESWWTGGSTYLVGGTTNPTVLTSSPHPLLNYNSFLWIADGNNLSYIIPNVATSAGGAAIGVNTGTGTQYILSLEKPATIYALGIDPATGLMMISFQTATNIAGSVSSQAYVGLYDGYSPGLRRLIPVDDIVTSFQNVSGTVYVGYGRRIGMWNGNGITFLRQLKYTVIGTVGTLPYKHHMGNIANILLVADGAYVLAYGEVVAGKKGWFYILSNAPGGTLTSLTCLFPLGTNKIGFGYASSKFAYLDITSTSGFSNCSVAFNNIYFPRPVFIRRMRVITNGIVATGGTNINISIQSEKGVNLPISISNASKVVTATTYQFDFDFTQAEVMAIQPVINLDDAASVLIRVYIYYDVAQ